MKKKSQKLLTLSLLVFCGSVSAANISQEIAIWEQVDRLLCIGRSGFECTGTDCIESTTSAVFRVNFSDMVIRFSDSSGEINLVERQFFDYSSINDSTSNFLFDDGRTMSFSHKNNDLFSEVVKATTIGSHYLLNDVTVRATEFECYQQ